MNDKLKFTLIATALIIILIIFGVFLITKGDKEMPITPTIDAEARQQILLIMNYLSFENPQKVEEFNQLLKQNK